MNPMDILAPNHMGVEFSNTGIDALAVNMGWGVPQVVTEQQKDNDQLQAVRRGASRQFGKPMENVF